MATHDAPSPRQLRLAKPSPLDLSSLPLGSSSTPTRIPQIFSAFSARGSIAPEGAACSPSPRAPTDLGTSHAPNPGGVGGAGDSGWAGLPAHLLELIFANLRGPDGVWPSRKVLFGVCGVCKLWRGVGYNLFFSNVWSSHTDVMVHPSQLFTLSPQPLRLPSSDHLLRCFVHRTLASASPGPASFPSPTGPASPRIGRLWRFSMYLGADHRSLCRVGAGGGGGSGGAGGGGGGGGGGEGAADGGPQLLMSAHQTSRRSYQLHLGPGPVPGAWQGRGGGGGGSAGGGGWASPRQHASPRRAQYRASRGGGGACPPGARGCSVSSTSASSGCVAVLRSNLRCSHYELVPEASCPWARRLISLAGYMGSVGGPPPPLIRLEYRLRVRGIMLPRRMKVQVPVPHSLQHVVHNPLYDMHEPAGTGGASAPGVAAAAAAAAAAGGNNWPLLAGGGGGAGGGPAVMAPPVLAAPPAAGVAGLAVGAGGAGAGLGGDGGEGLMDNLEDILEAAIRTEPLLFANLVDAAAAVQPDDDDVLDAAAAAAPAAGGEAGPAAAAVGGGGGGGGPGGLFRRRTLGGGSGWGFGTSLLRGFFTSRGSAAAASAGAGGGGNGGGGGGGGSVQWWGPLESPPGGGGGGAAATAAAGGGGAGAVAASAGWSCSSPAAPVPSVRLQNKAPHWNDALMCWCLNFRGRVKMASVKNFQLMACGDGAGRCVMQFGKVEEGIYILDFNPCVLTAAQAFAAALSTFETKYLL